MPEKQTNRRKKSINFYLMTTQIVNKYIKMKKNKDKLNNDNEGEIMDLLDEQKTQRENEFSFKLKDRAECLLTVFLGYFLGVIQKNISSNSFESNNNNYNLIIGQPDPKLVEAIKNSKNYKKMIEEQEKEKNEDNKIIKNKKASIEIQVQIEGKNFIPEFTQNSIYSKNYNNNNNNYNNIINNIPNKNFTNGFDFNENQNPNKINENNININIINEKEKESNNMSNNIINEINNNNELNNEKNEINIENNNNEININNENEINDILKNNNDIMISQKDDKNSNEENEKEIINSNGINENKNMERLKYSPETEDKSDIKIFESEKRDKKKSSFAEKDIEAKDKLKNLKIEVTCKKLEDQIKILLNEKHMN